LPACNRIDIGKGVCGTAVKIKKTLVVPDVHKFPGHIACDTHSNSEIVMPLFHNKRVFGVLDIDSPKRNRFHKLEIDILNEVVNLINQFIQRIN
jgi:GAF domain-containing protein